MAYRWMLYMVPCCENECHGLNIIYSDRTVCIIFIIFLGYKISVFCTVLIHMFIFIIASKSISWIKTVSQLFYLQVFGIVHKMLDTVFMNCCLPSVHEVQDGLFLFYAPEKDQWVGVEIVKEKIFQDWTASTKDNFVCLELYLIITDQCNISRTGVYEKIT